MVSVSIDVDRSTLGDFRTQMKLTIEGRPVMRCLACIPDGSDWSLECHTKGELSS